MQSSIEKFRASNPRGLVQPCLVALCKKSTRNQPISNHHTWIPTVGMTVGLREINRVPTLILESRRLVLRKPTAFQPLYIIAYSWNDGWFWKNQPRSNLRILKHMVGMTVGFTKTNRHQLVVLYEGRNTVGFLSIFCTNQPVGIRLVDSWTSPRGKNYEKLKIFLLIYT